MLGDVYIWDKAPRTNKFLYQLIPIQTIVRPVFVVNSFWRNGNDEYNVLHPSSLDSFYVLDIKYFDRSGMVEENDTEDIDHTLETTEGQLQYLLNEQTEKSLLFCRENNNGRGADTEDESQLKESQGNLFEEVLENESSFEDDTSSCNESS